MNHFENYEYPLQYHNIKYLSRLSSPYSDYLHTRWNTTDAIKFCESHKGMNSSALFRDDQRLHIIDDVPLSLHKLNVSPVVLRRSILSPTFGVSIFHVSPVRESQLNSWSKRMKILHGMLKGSIEDGGSINLIGDLHELHETYQNIYDRDHTMNCDPMEYFLAIALLDLYHLYMRDIPFDANEIRIRPENILIANPLKEYVDRYSVIFQMSPHRQGYQDLDSIRDTQRMSKSYFKGMKRDVFRMKEIDHFLRKNGQTELLKDRSECLKIYNKCSTVVMKAYLLTLLNAFNTSPLVKNKKECIDCIKHWNKKLEEEANPVCTFIEFERCLRRLMLDNSVDISGPFLFPGLIEDTFTPVPPLWPKRSDERSAAP